ncbi:MAG: C1 family peptidase [Eubacteriales bacterium]|nr:C1 family peptidase [Eubacteriales bacterium]
MKKTTRRRWARLAVLSLIFANASVPFAAYADQNTLMDGEAAARLLLKNRQEQIAGREPAKESAQEFPETFDLRDRGVVTPVKLQNPWGTCWGFSAIAAAETSILSEMGKTYEETGLDLSEHHLTYFARTYLNDGSSQDGEGIHMLDEGGIFDTGGLIFTATSLFSSGMGVVDEDTIPYRGKNSETYAEAGINYWYDSEDDWLIPDEYKFLQTYELEHSEILDSPVIYDPSVNLDELSTMAERNEAYAGYDQAATDRMKQALMDGYGISVSYAADQFTPDQLGEDTEPEYINTSDNKWTHYTYDAAPVTHAVTIVGWDDRIKAEDFLDHSEDQYGDGLPHQPEGDGAWIVKNSWGAATEKFPNQFEWGIQDETGRETGYFYLSYYDRSLSLPEIFDFRVKDDGAPGYIIDQYDYLQSDGTEGWIDKNGLKTANVFTAEFDEILRGLSCETSMKNTDVTYDVYLLNEDAAVPTDGGHVLTAEAFYELPGYHRLDLDTENQVEIAKGQRYAVVLTQETEYGEEHYYAVSTTTGISEEAADAYNREQKVEHAEGAYMEYYAQGVVNPGESYVYFADRDAWSDFSQVIPGLQKHEDFAELTFDNFPIKAYLDFKNEADQTASGGNDIPPLGYAEPAGALNYKQIAGYLAPRILALAILVSYAALIVITVRRKRQTGATAPQERQRRNRPKD